MKAAIVLLTLILSACSSPRSTRENTNAARKFPLAKVENFTLGKTTHEELINFLGEPDQIISLSEKEEFWVYLEKEGEIKTQRLGLVLDKAQKVLLTTTWMPKPSDELHHKDKALSYFKGSQFKVKDVGWIANHYYSDDKTYSDTKTGVSMFVYSSDQTVRSISFIEPRPELPTRKTASKNLKH